MESTTDLDNTDPAVLWRPSRSRLPLHRHQTLAKPESQVFLVVDLPTGVIVNNFKAEPRGVKSTID